VFPFEPPPPPKLPSERSTWNLIIAVCIIAMVVAFYVVTAS
jgi:hypothetical protein